MLLCDIEGTTTAIAFVYETLFPYAARTLEPFLEAHVDDPAVTAACALVRADATPDEAALGRDASVLAVVRRQMAGDVKATGLKRLQGLIWQHGYATGAVRGQVFDDVPAVFATAHAGAGVAIYSSGSVLAQQLLFRHSVAGDLTPLIRAYFDTTTGPKQEADSYRAIADALDVATSAITFATDRIEEAAAAAHAGCRAVVIMRPGNPPLRAGLPYEVHADLRSLT
jgi:enolase-phosphatase E1